MSDYINFIDFNAIKLADLAYEIGDYKCALDNYTKALNRLRNYQGDQMQQIMMGSKLATKVDEVSKKVAFGKPILKFDGWKLTKSSFVKGSQCVKYLYLDKHKKNEKTPISHETRALFAQGHSFEELVRNHEFPDGIKVKDKAGNFAYFNSYTKYLLNAPNEQIIFEATIIEEEVLVMCDILVKNKEGHIHIYEIKLNTTLNEAIKSDLALQYAICKKRFSSNLKSFNLILRSLDENKKWEIIDLTSELDMELNSVAKKIVDYKCILQNVEPVLSMGGHCNTPYGCEFIQYCKSKSTTTPNP